jgi:ribosomal protein S4
MRVRAGGVVNLTAAGKKIPAATATLANARPPAYLDTDKEKGTVKLLEIPMRDKVPVICEVGMVVEFYSR